MQPLTSDDFIKILISIAVAAIGFVTFYLAVRRFRMERAILAVRPFRIVSGMLEISIENVGGRAALDVALSSGDESYAHDAIRVGDVVVARIQKGLAVTSINLTFRDADNWRRNIAREVEWNGNQPTLKPRTVPRFWKRRPRC